MKPPTLADIRSAFEYGNWVRNEECTREGRMLADLAWSYQDLRTKMEKAERVTMDALLKRNQAEADRDTARQELEHALNQLKASDVLRASLYEEIHRKTP